MDPLSQGAHPTPYPLRPHASAGEHIPASPRPRRRERLQSRSQLGVPQSAPATCAPGPHGPLGLPCSASLGKPHSRRYHHSHFHDPRVYVPRRPALRQFPLQHIRPRIRRPPDLPPVPARTGVIHHIEPGAHRHRNSISVANAPNEEPIRAGVRR